MHDEPFEARHDRAIGTLVVSGAIDETSVAEFREALREATDDYAARVVIDLNRVTFLPSMAVGVLLGAMARTPGTRVQMELGSPAQMTLEVLGLDEYAMTGRRLKGA